MLDPFDLFSSVTCQNASKGHRPGQGRALPFLPASHLPFLYADFMPVTCFLVIMCPDSSHMAPLGQQLQEAISNQVTGSWEGRKRRIKNEVKEE